MDVRFSAPVQTGSGVLYNGFRVSSPRVKWPRRGVDHPLPSSTEAKEGVESGLYSLYFSDFMEGYRVNFLFLKVFAAEIAKVKI